MPGSPSLKDELDSDERLVLLIIFILDLVEVSLDKESVFTEGRFCVLGDVSLEVFEVVG